MATALAILSIDAQGNAVIQNGTTNVEPVQVWLERNGVLVPGSPDEIDANQKAYTYPGVQPGDIPYAQRINAKSPVHGPAVPAPVTPPPPPPVAPTVTAGTPVVSGSTVVISATTNSVVTSASLFEDGSTTPILAAPVSGKISFTLTSVAAGSHSAVITVKSADGQAASATVTFTVIAVQPPPPPVISASYGMPTDIFNRKIAADAPTDPQNTAWMAMVSASKNTAGSALATQLASGGWPINVAGLKGTNGRTADDPIITIPGAYQNATCRVPQSVIVQGDADGHCMIVEPPGVNPNPKFAGMTVWTEVGNAKITGTWPNITIAPQNGASPCQFNVSTTNGNFQQNLAGSGAPGAARGCAICCAAGLTRADEFDAGLIPHAMAATAPYTAGAPYVAASKNTGAAGQPRLPALISDGGTPGGIPECAHLQLDLAYDISGLSSSLRIIAKCHQDYGLFLTDSTNTAIAFQGQAAESASNPSAAYIALGQGGSLAGLPWSHYRVLAAGQ